MKRKPMAPKLIKTSISLPEVLMDFAVKQCEQEGYSSFSSYLAALVRADRDRQRTTKENPVKYSSGSLAMEETLNEEAQKKKKAG